MSAPSCPGCRERDERLAALEARVRELEGQLGRNASNSSLPPSANPPQAPAPVIKTPSGKKRGAQPGHPPALRRRLPPERLQEVIPFVPTTCGRCQAPLPAAAGPGDPEPTWHQVAELPDVAAHVVEYQGHARTCLCCGEVTHAVIPAEVRAHAIGPRLAAVLSYLVGGHRVSRRGVEEIAEAVFDVPVSLGTVCRLETQMAEALAPAHAEAVQAVREAPAKHVDETGWKQAGARAWLWVGATAAVAAFVLHARRGLTGLQALLGEAVTGILITDRWSVYNGRPTHLRQVCWSHLRRDFQAMIDRGGAGAAIGKELLTLCNALFRWWHRVRDGTLQRRTFQTRAAWLREDVQIVLERGRVGGCAKTAATCRELLAVEAALWTFVTAEGVEPTNNLAERMLRPAVLWRKGSFGCVSAAGCRFVERMLTVVQTLRLQQRPVLAYLENALRAHRNDLPAPKLLPIG
jgi:transposase